MATSDTSNDTTFDPEFEEPHTNTRQYQGDQRLHSDAAYLRRLHSIANYDPSVSERPELLPALVDHTWDGGADRLSGGPSLFTVGPEGTGKSTLLLTLSEMLMELNDSRVVWRGATGSRSEWLPFAPITHLCIPKGYEVEARAVPKERSRTSLGQEVDIGDVVRDVKTYNDVMDLNLNVLEDGVFHVVFPDPEMRGCQKVYDESDRVVAGRKGEVQFIGGHDPVDHWWFGWGLSLVEHGPFPWTDWICDEVGSLAPEGAANDKYGTLLKIKLLGEAMEDWRKNGCGRYFAGHKDKHLHSLFTDRIRWRITMNGTANPRESRASSYPKGFETVPMYHDLTSDMNIGEALLYRETSFTPISWPNIEKPFRGDLKIYLNRETAPVNGRGSR